MDLGKDIENSVIEEKMAVQKPNQCALLIYTVSYHSSHCCSVTYLSACSSCRISRSPNYSIPLLLTEQFYRYRIQ